MLTIALCKGRMLDTVVSLLQTVGLSPSEDILDSRQLIVSDSTHADVRYLLVKPVDVPAFVQYGAADLGLVGKDVLYEAGADLHELLDLRSGICKMAVAGFAGTDIARVHRVATKYPRAAREYFRERSQQIEVIDISGSVEVAPLVGLADCIVDLVETGRTLAENGLVILDEVGVISTRLVANRSSYQLRAKEIDPLMDRLRKAVTGSSANLPVAMSSREVTA
ncbi:MAG: ATP phosphoribosyltransferase [Firmicutes bacterium]|nr:ATP phosphoribosyltransferase [Bacillota bacterium]